MKIPHQVNFSSYFWFEFVLASSWMAWPQVSHTWMKLTLTDVVLFTGHIPIKFYCFLIMKTCFVLLPESRVTSIIAGNFIRNPFSPLFHPWAKEAGLLSRCLRIIAIMRLWLRLRRESGDTRPRAPDWGESSVMPATWGDHHGAVTQCWRRAPIYQAWHQHLPSKRCLVSRYIVIGTFLSWLPLHVLCFLKGYCNLG